LVDDLDPAKAIFKTIRGQVPADIKEALFLAAHLESRQLQYQWVAQRITDRAAQAQLKEEMLQLKQIADEKHKNISSLQTSGAELKQKILDLSTKRMTLLADLKELMPGRKKASYPMLSRLFSKKEISKLAKPWQ
jgi:hypothetical protein